MAATLTASILSGCSSLGGSFGETAAALPEPPQLQFVAADEVLPDARNSFQQHNYGYSAAYYKRALELTPNDEEALVGLAASYDRLRRFDLSDRVYAQLLVVDGGTSQYYNNVGYSYMLRGNLVAARQSFLKARDLDPTSQVVANNLALLDASTSE
jgi:Flp pilus assembly protein TadD